MSRALSKVPSYQIGSDFSEVPSLHHLAKELKSLKIWQKQEPILKEKERVEGDKYLTTLEEELRILNAKQVKVQEELRQSKCRSNSKRSSKRNTQLTHYEEDSKILNQYYQPPPQRRPRREREQELREVRVDLPHFHWKENVEAYLDWEMKVEQLFECHQVSEEKTVSLANLSFLGNAMYWWTSLVREKRLSNSPKYNIGMI